MRALDPAQYLDAYGPGVNVVLLTIDDDLGAEALACFTRVADRPNHYVTFWTCRITGPEDTEAVECSRVPQYRFIVDGSEKTAHIGILEDEELITAIAEL